MREVVSESCPEDEMLENGKTLVSLGFPSFKEEAMTSQLQDFWVLLSQRTKKSSFLILTNGAGTLLASSVYFVRGQHPDQEGAVCFRTCVCAVAGVCKRVPGKEELLTKTAEGKEKEKPFPPHCFQQSGDQA